MRRFLVKIDLGIKVIGNFKCSRENIRKRDSGCLNGMNKVRGREDFIGLGVEIGWIEVFKIEGFFLIFRRLWRLKLK